MDWQTVATGRGYNFQIGQRVGNGRWKVRRVSAQGRQRGTVVYSGDHGLKEYAEKEARERAEKWAGGKVLFL